MKIKSIHKIDNHNSKRYKKKKKKNSNFFANNILVHNCTWYNDYMHARSINSDNHPSRNWVKNLWAQKAYNIPEGWRVCG